MSGTQLIIHVVFSTVEHSSGGLLVSWDTLGPVPLLKGVTSLLRGLPLADSFQQGLPFALSALGTPLPSASPASPR